MTISDNDVAMLTSMGFEASQAREALSVCGGNLENAANYILGGGAPGPSSSTGGVTAGPLSTPEQQQGQQQAGSVVHCGRSQYSLDDGRSACTCIALTAAARFLGSPEADPSFLETVLDDGVASYRKLHAGGNPSVEHLSAEEVLAAGAGTPPFSSLRLLEGGVRQGLLSPDAGHPMGLGALLEGLSLEQPPGEWMAVLITKTPETVLLCLPPRGGGDSFWLIDSHPRPQLGTSSAYALPHPSLASLLGSLRTILPPADLGPEIPEMMAMMYNSFDLYPLLPAKQN